MPIIEEIDDEDIDNMDYDPADFDVNNPFHKDTPVEGGGVQLRSTAGRTSEPARPQGSASNSQDAAGFPGFPLPSGPDALLGPGGPGGPGGAAGLGPVPSSNDIPEHMKSWSIIYPVYFDAKRSQSEGRRVPIDQAVDTPLATTIADALKSFGYDAGLELIKGHPKDWANPGRVRVDAKGSKRKLYKQISDYLKTHPANDVTARVQLYRRFAQFDEPHPLAVPRGMKIGKTLPGISPALSASKAIEEAMGGDQMSKMFGM